MTEKDKSNILSKEAFEELLFEVMEETGDWSMSNPMELLAMVESKRRSLKRAEDLIKNPVYRERAIKASKEEQARQAKILEQGRIPTVYDDEYVGDDDDYDDDECYPDDE